MKIEIFIPKKSADKIVTALNAESVSWRETPENADLDIFAELGIQTQEMITAVIDTNDPLDLFRLGVLFPGNTLPIVTTNVQQ